MRGKCPMRFTRGLRAVGLCQYLCHRCAACVAAASLLRVTEVIACVILAIYISWLRALKAEFVFKPFLFSVLT